MSRSDVLLAVDQLKTWIQGDDGAVRAVDGVSFTLRRNQTFALLGESGCGKSMTALSILRLLPPAARIIDGRVRLDGEDLLALPESAMRRIRGKRIAMIFQEPNTALNPVLTVREQIGEVLRIHRGLTRQQTLERTVELLDQVGISDAARRLGEYPHQLSGGMKQRVMLAAALAGDPELLIADEPTTALDVTIQAQVLELLKRLQRNTGMSILLITHDLGVVAQLADEVGVMYAGHLVERANCSTLFSAPQHPYTQKLFDSLPTAQKRAAELAVIRGFVPSLRQEMTGCRFAPRCDRAWELCKVQAPRYVELDQGARHVRCHLHDPEIEQPERIRRDGNPDLGNNDLGNPDLDPAILDAPPREPDSSLPVLQVEQLKVHFPIQRGIFRRTVGWVQAVDGVSLRIARGRTLALVGESGCGKTTAGKAMLQLLKPTGGSVRFNGVELTRLDRANLRTQRRHMQIVFQDPFASLNPRMMVRDILEEGLIAQRIGSIRTERQAHIDRLLAQVGLDAQAKDRYPHEFSGGQRQRICIARALAVEPQLLICDEPTSALDMSVQAQILNLLRELQTRLGLAYLFITHNLAVVEYLAHEVAVMYLGRIVEHGPVAEVLAHPRHPYTEALLSAVPTPDPQSRRRIIRLKGDLPSPATPPTGCHFHPRCPKAFDACRHNYPPSIEVGSRHHVRCLLFDPAQPPRPVSS